MAAIVVLSIFMLNFGYRVLKQIKHLIQIQFFSVKEYDETFFYLFLHIDESLKPLMIVSKACNLRQPLRVLKFHAVSQQCLQVKEPFHVCT